MVNTRRTNDPHFLLSHIEFPQGRVDYRAIFDENDPEKFAFIKLLEAINLRASEMSALQPTFPKMDLSALYCLGITIQEYVRHLSTDVLAQKRAAENKSPINNSYTPQEIKARTLEAVIQKYKPQTSTIANAQHAPPVTARPNIDQELHHSAKHPHHQVEIKTSEKAGRYDKIASDPKWTGTLVKSPRDLKANSEQAAARRAKAEANQKKRLEAQQAMIEREGRQQEKIELLLPRKRVRSADDDTNYDIFDKANHSKPKKAKGSSRKKKKTAPSSQKGF
ncbi:uncharacterized protein ATC70_011512 [Mucor velutinosus]|uniref:Uncharacterized protein n=1 Tax=Mucor velutinosus TaxID=708070 RepID=A0AAN7DGU0_9FUNG|nr:hypothetical protein ATC70_011512 [Mucor velutinosus]